MTRARLSAAAALLITSGFLWLAARNVEFSRLGEVLLSARLVWLVPMLLAGLVDLMIRSVRWRILLSSVVAAPFGLLFRLETIGLAVNNVLFARLGELARAALAARELKIPLATALASVAVERVLDVCAILILFNAAALAAPGLVAPAVRQGGLLVLAGAMGALVFLVLAEKTLEPGGGLERRLQRWPKLHDLVVQLVMGAAVLRKPQALLPAVGLSLALWSVDVTCYWSAARALGLGAIMDFQRAALVLSWAGAGSALPAAPGGIGTFEAMVASIVEKIGAAPHQAFGYAVFTHAVMYLFVTSLGLIFLYKIGLSLGGLEEALKRKP